jgi:hypothetical protein
MKDARDELVRIDKSGSAHAIGTVASQRMRAREGAYRMLPGPKHVVFMRYTGEDGRRDDEDGAIVRLAGEITSPGTMCDVLALLGQTGWKGELAVMVGQTARSIFFEQGNIVGVQTTEPSERLGAVMYQYGMLSQVQLDEAMELVREGRRFGEATVELGFLDQSKVYDAIRKQVEDVVLATLTVSDGTFFFLHEFDDLRLVSHQVVSANALLMDGVTRMDELRYFRQKIPSSDYIPLRVEERSQPAEEYLKVYAAVDGTSSVEDIGRLTGLGEFETTKLVYSLIQSKHLTVRPPRISGGPVAIVATANDVLAAAFRHVEAIGKQQELTDSVKSFAVGAGVYDILLRNAGPDAHGRLDPERVAENSAIVASGSDPENVLRQMLHDYVSFALFSAGAVLGRAGEAALGKEVAAPLAELCPQG